VSVRQSVCLSRRSTAAAAGLLLSALWTGDIDRQLWVRGGHRAAGAGAQQQRAAGGNAGSVTLTADVGG